MITVTGVVVGCGSSAFTIFLMTSSLMDNIHTSARGEYEWVRKLALSLAVECTAVFKL